jgi:soluble lytic murein transglycosylase-like protein
MTNEYPTNNKGIKSKIKWNLAVLAVMLSCAGAVGLCKYLQTERNEEIKPKDSIEQAGIRPQYGTNRNDIAFNITNETDKAYFKPYGITNDFVTNAEWESIKRTWEAEKELRAKHPELYNPVKSNLEQKIETPINKNNQHSKENKNYFHPVTPELVNHVVYAESQGDANATSQKGARGVAQLMPKTWEEQTRKMYGKPLPFSEAYNPDINLEVGTNYLNDLHNSLSKRLKGYNQLPVIEQQKKIVAAYNGGPNRLIRKKGKIERMPRETRRYVSKIANGLAYNN